MGNLEKENRKIVRRTKIQEAILLTLVSGGRMGSELITEALINSLLGTDFSLLPRKKEIIKSSTNRLREKGLLKFENGRYVLTQAGQVTLEHWKLLDFKLPKPKKWDKKWRIVIFDIPERKKRIRNEVRSLFVNAGFKRLQDSVWVYPYDCEDVIGLLKTESNIGRELLYIIADQIENDKYLREEFGLIK